MHTCHRGVCYFPVMRVPIPIAVTCTPLYTADWAHPAPDTLVSHKQCAHYLGFSPRGSLQHIDATCIHPYQSISIQRPNCITTINNYVNTQSSVLNMLNKPVNPLVMLIIHVCYVKIRQK